MFEIDRTQRDRIRELCSPQRQRIYEFPWTGFEEVLANAPGGRVSLAGYGSLLNPDSARRTILSTPADGHPPVMAYGGRRVFDYVMPEGVLTRYGTLDDPVRVAALNVEPTEPDEGLFNARSIPLHVEDLGPLREREIGYALIPVAMIDWHEPGSSPMLGYALAAGEQSGRKASRSRKPMVLPHPDYVTTCRLGAQRVSSEFEAVFLQTSFLADGQTTLASYLSTDSTSSADDPTTT